MSENIHSMCASCGGANGAHLDMCDRDRLMRCPGCHRRPCVCVTISLPKETSDE